MISSFYSVNFDDRKCSKMFCVSGNKLKLYRVETDQFSMSHGSITAAECLEEFPMEVDQDYIRTVILCGQAKAREVIDRDAVPFEDDTTGLML